MFNFNAKLLKKIEDEKNNHMQMCQELREEIDRFKKSAQLDYKFFYDEISKHNANNYIKKSEIGNIIKDEMVRQKKKSEIYEMAKRLPKIRDISVNKPVPTENTDEYKNLPTIKKDHNHFVFVGDSDVYKDLPLFISSNQFAEILNLSIHEFHNCRKGIEKKVPKLKFGLQTYRYKKSDVLRFIKYPYEIIDTLAYLKNQLPDKITKYQLLEGLCVSENAFRNARIYIEKKIPPIVLGHRSTWYDKSDVIKFIERRGLSVRY